MTDTAKFLINYKLSGQALAAIRVAREAGGRWFTSMGFGADMTGLTELHAGGLAYMITRSSMELTELGIQARQRLMADHCPLCDSLIIHVSDHEEGCPQAIGERY